MQSAFLSAMPIEAIAAAALAFAVVVVVVTWPLTRSKAHRAVGKIVDLLPAQDASSPFDEAFPVVEFEDETGGIVRVRLQDRLSRALHAVGETVSVAYDPRNPKRAQLAF
ncbi:MAG: DUF3592 domain-containing protein [Pseudomonadota bacterium]